MGGELLLLARRLRNGGSRCGSSSGGRCLFFLLSLGRLSLGLGSSSLLL
jgi:hypothetical protein